MFHPRRPFSVWCLPLPLDRDAAMHLAFGRAPSVHTRLTSPMTTHCLTETGLNGQRSALHEPLELEAEDGSVALGLVDLREVAAPAAPVPAGWGRRHHGERGARGAAEDREGRERARWMTAGSGGRP